MIPRDDTIQTVGSQRRLRLQRGTPYTADEQAVYSDMRVSRYVRRIAVGSNLVDKLLSLLVLSSSFFAIKIRQTSK